MFQYSRLLVRHHWSVLGVVISICIILTVVGLVFTELPDFSDPRIGWGARGKGTIFSQLMVLKHASEKFRRAYELPIENFELFNPHNQFSNSTVEDLDEKTYQTDFLLSNDLWLKRDKKRQREELMDYKLLDENFYDQDWSDDENPTYDDDHVNEQLERSDQSSSAGLLYQWHRDRHFDMENVITKYVDDKVINISVFDLVRNLPQFNRSHYRFARLPFDLFRPYAHLLEEKYRGRTGRDGMIEFYIERTKLEEDLLSFEHLRSICKWEKRFKEVLELDHSRSLSLATFVALYAGKNHCQLITQEDVLHFRRILETCLPYYVDGYMDIPLSEMFLNRVVLEHHPGEFSYQEKFKAVYTALRHTCFYKNITRFVFDHFLDKRFIEDLQKSNATARVSLSMIYISNYGAVRINRTRDKIMCSRREPYSREYCLNRGCAYDIQNNFTLVRSCVDPSTPNINCESYCRCKHQCPNETEQVLVINPIYKSQELVHIFEKNFAGKRQLPMYQDQFIRLVALNLANVRERAAMAGISEDMLLVLIATALIIGITVIYLRSVSIALVIIIGAGLSIGVSYFIYRVIYRIPIFPFMNLMSAFILIGIGCDDIFVFFDTWDQEKAEWLRQYQEKQELETSIPLNPLDSTSANENERERRKYSKHKRVSTWNDPDEIRRLLLREDALVEILGKTLKHAASSMFVTSFTTSAAFFTNMLTNISFVQVFGVFTGTCILIYFVITVTAIAAFAIIYEKYIQDILTRLLSVRLTGVVDTSTDNSSAKLCRRIITVCRDFRSYLFGQLLPKIILRLKYLLVALFLPMGVLGIVGVFHYPKLRVPSTQKVAFFLKDNPMEVYEFSMKTMFNGYLKEEKRLFAYPSVSFIFGIRDIDDGYIFDMNDRGNLHLVPIKLGQQQTLDFFKKFITDLGTRSDLFSSNYDLEKDFETFYQLTSEDILAARIIDDRARLNVSNSTHLQMIQYLATINSTLVETLISKAIRPKNYTIQLDFSDQEDYVENNNRVINRNLRNRSFHELLIQKPPVINYGNYRKLFNRTLVKIYKDQIARRYDRKEISDFLQGGERDRLIEGYHRSALKTAFQCLTGAAGANNIPMDFCDQQLSKQRSINWAVLPDKPSPIDGSVEPFAVIISIRGSLNRTDYDSYNNYYQKVKEFFDPYIKRNAPEHLRHAWFSSPGFAFYGIQRELLVGSYSSLIASLGIALLVLFLTSGNLFIAFYALITITFAIAVSVAIFAALKWELGIVEAIIVIMSVGLSVDFVVHFGVGYIHTDSHNIEQERKKIHDSYQSDTLINGSAKEKNNIHSYRVLYEEHQIEREVRVIESITRVGSAVFMAAFTTFAAGFSMTLSSLTSFRQMGQFLMTIMLTSWLFATFFFLPLCAIIGPVGKCGSIPFFALKSCFRRWFSCFGTRNK